MCLTPKRAVSFRNHFGYSFTDLEGLFTGNVNVEEMNLLVDSNKSACIV